MGVPSNMEVHEAKTLKIKKNEKLMKKQKNNLNFDICRRISEEDIVNLISIVDYVNVDHWTSDLCIDNGIMLKANRMQPSRNNSLTNVTKTRSKSRF